MRTMTSELPKSHQVTTLNVTIQRESISRWETKRLIG